MIYGFTFNVDGNAAEKLAAMKEALKAAGIEAVEVKKKVDESGEQMIDTFKRVGEVIAATFAIEKIKEFGREILETTAEFEGFRNRIQFASVNTADATRNLDFLKETVQDLHVPLRETMQGFSDMEAGLSGTNIQGERLRQLFTGITVAATSLHLPNAQLERTLYDLKEIGEVGVNMRVGRSLIQQFTGIGPVIKQVFHKSIQELAQERFSGTEFLTKLGPALAKYYAGGQAAYSSSLQAHMVDTQNEYIDTQLSLGEKLKPVYIDLMNAAIGAMKGIQGFVDVLYKNRQTVIEVAEAVRGLIIAWGIYKVTTLAVEGVNLLSNISFRDMKIVLVEATEATEGMAAANEELSISMASLGWGALLVGLGLVIEKFAEWNNALDASLDKISNLKKFQEDQGRESDKYADIISEYSQYGSMTAANKGSLLNEVNADMSQLSSSTVNMQGRIQDIQSRMAAIHPTTENVKMEGGGFKKMTVYPDEYFDLQHQLDGLKDVLNISQLHMGNLMNIQDRLTGDKIKPNDAYNAAGVQQGVAGELSGLGGARGGLGEAKVINIHIDTMQKVTTSDNADLKNKGRDAVEVMLRTLDNIAYSQTVTQ
jgi:hypothetical protein